MYTDGACVGNPGPGGWAWAVPGGRWRSGAAAHSTNQRMEITAALEAARSLPAPSSSSATAPTSSTVSGDAWWEKWLAKGWVNSAKKPVANRDLWEPLVDLYRETPRRLRFRWVKGHANDPFNDLVDRLAVAAAASQRGAEGDDPPELASIGPPDLVFMAAARSCPLRRLITWPVPPGCPRTPPGAAEEQIRQARTALSTPARTRSSTR